MPCNAMKAPNRSIAAINAPNDSMKGSSRSLGGKVKNRRALSRGMRGSLSGIGTGERGSREADIPTTGQILLKPG